MAPRPGWLCLPSYSPPCGAGAGASSPPTTHSPPTLEETAQAKAAHEGRLLRLAVAFDIFINVLLLNGQEDETISTHAWRAKLEGKRWGKAVSWWLDLFQPGHGAQAAAGDLERAEERIAVEKKALGL